MKLCDILGYFGICGFVAGVYAGLAWAFFSFTVAVCVFVPMFCLTALWMSWCWMSDKCDREAGYK